MTNLLSRRLGTPMCDGCKESGRSLTPTADGKSYCESCKPDAEAKQQHPQAGARPAPQAAAGLPQRSKNDVREAAAEAARPASAKSSEPQDSLPQRSKSNARESSAAKVSPPAVTETQRSPRETAASPSATGSQPTGQTAPAEAPQRARGAPASSAPPASRREPAPPADVANHPDEAFTATLRAERERLSVRRTAVEAHISAANEELESLSSRAGHIDSLLNELSAWQKKDAASNSAAA